MTTGEDKIRNMEGTIQNIEHAMMTHPYAFYHKLSDGIHMFSFCPTANISWRTV